jgi:hypothetical protein
MLGGGVTPVANAFGSSSGTMSPGKLAPGSDGHLLDHVDELRSSGGGITI